jgi:hypothetical protein
MLRRFLAAQPETTLAGNVEIMASCVRQGASGVRWDELARTRPLPLVNAAFSLAAGGGHLPCSARAFQQILAIDTAENPDADGRRWSSIVGLQAVLLAQGRSPEAAEAVDAFNTRWQYGASLFLLAGPLDSLMGRRAREIASTDSARYGATYARMPYNFRLWEIGQWKLHEGRRSIAESIANTLRQRADTSRKAMDHLLARSLEARVTLARGDTTRATELLRTIVPSSFPVAQLQWHEMAPAPAERLLLAHILRAKGDHLNASSMADVIDSPGASIHVLYLPSSLKVRLDAASALGDGRMQSMLRRRIAALAIK